MTNVMPQVWLKGREKSLPLVDKNYTDADFINFEAAQAYFDAHSFVPVMMPDEFGNDDHVELIPTSSIERISFVEMEDQR